MLLLLGLVGLRQAGCNCLVLSGWRACLHGSLKWSRSLASSILWRSLKCAPAHPVSGPQWVGARYLQRTRYSSLVRFRYQPEQRLDSGAWTPECACRKQGRQCCSAAGGGRGTCRRRGSWWNAALRAQRLPGRAFVLSGAALLQNSAPEWGPRRRKQSAAAPCGTRQNLGCPGCGRPAAVAPAAAGSGSRARRSPAVDRPSSTGWRTWQPSAGKWEVQPVGQPPGHREQLVPDP